MSEVPLEASEKLSVTDCCRVGVRRDKAAIWPIEFAVSTSHVLNQILRKAKLLRSREGFKPVYICADETVTERRANKKVLEQLRLKREAEPVRIRVIQNNKIISCSENLASKLPG